MGLCRKTNRAFFSIFAHGPAHEASQDFTSFTTVARPAADCGFFAFEPTAARRLVRGRGRPRHVPKRCPDTSYARLAPMSPPHGARRQGPPGSAIPERAEREQCLRHLRRARARCSKSAGGIQNRLAQSGQEGPRMRAPPRSRADNVHRARTGESSDANAWAWVPARLPAVEMACGRDHGSD